MWCMLENKSYLIVWMWKKKHIHVCSVGVHRPGTVLVLVVPNLKTCLKTVILFFYITFNFFWCIVEFPAVLLNTNSGEIESEFHMYVQPQEHTKLSDFCKELTGITQVCSEKHHFNADRGILIFLMFLSENVSTVQFMEKLVFLQPFCFF